MPPGRATSTPGDFAIVQCFNVTEGTEPHADKAKWFVAKLTPNGKRAPNIECPHCRKSYGTSRRGKEDGQGIILHGSHPVRGVADEKLKQMQLGEGAAQ